VRTVLDTVDPDTLTDDADLIAALAGLVSGRDWRTVAKASRSAEVARRVEWIGALEESRAATEARVRAGGPGRIVPRPVVADPAGEARGVVAEIVAARGRARGRG
jgi:hypothetical protein